MGADSSTLQSIESLNSTLNDIERKLFVIEDVHLHHERTVSLDDCIIIASKRIQCTPDVRLLVGPVTGIVTDHTARILVETNLDSEISFNIFEENKTLLCDRFLSTVKIFAFKSTPVAITLSDLCDDTVYSIYIGGVNCNDALSKFCKIRTLPRSSSKIKCIISSSGKIDQTAPGEIGLWKPLKDVTCGGSQSEPVHLHIHCGNLVSVENIVRSRVLELLDLLVRDDTNSDAWVAMVDEIELLVKEHYRAALSTEPLRSIVRRCGNIFLAGPDEACHATSALMSVGLPESSAKNSKIRASIASPTSPSRRSVTSEGMNRSWISKKANVSQRSLDGSSTAEDKRTPKEKLQEAVCARAEVYEEFRHLLAAMLIRIARRVHWSYLRQLWDEDAAALLIQDQEKEFYYRQIVKLRKTIQMKKFMHLTLEISVSKFTAEFGPSKAPDNMRASAQVLKDDIDQLEIELRNMAIKSSEVAATHAGPPNGGCLRLSPSAVLVLIETAWSWLTVDGQLSIPFNREVEVHQQIHSQIEDLLLPKLPVLQESQGAEAVLSLPSNSVNTIICVSAAPLAPHLDGKALELALLQSYRCSPADDPQLFQISPLDSKRLLKLFAKWQQETEERAVLLAAVCENQYSAKGVSVPIVLRTETSEEVEKDEEFEDPQLQPLDIWNSERCKLQHLLVGSMSGATTSKLHSLEAIQIMQSTAAQLPPPDENPLLVKDTALQFRSVLSSSSFCFRRSYWEIKLCPKTAPQPSASSTTGYVAGTPATFDASAVSDQLHPVQVQLGPVIGAVTVNSAVVMLETVHDCQVELLCVDQVTGKEVVCSRLAYGKKPCHFVFEGLEANRAYEVCVANYTSSAIAAGDIKAAPADHAVCGSFTTAKLSLLNGWEEVGEKSDANTIVSLRQQNNADPSVKSRSALSLNPSVAASFGGEGSMHSSAVSFLPTSPIRLVIVGAVTPTCQRWSAAQVDAAPSVALDRSHVIQGLGVIKQIEQVLGQSWSGVDMVLHCGSNVDLGLTIDAVILHLSDAEKHVLGAGHQSSRGQDPGVACYLELAEAKLRQAYTYHWSNAATHSFLAHGNHRFMTSPMFDVLQLLHAGTLRALARDYSSYCVAQLVHLVTKLAHEYQREFLTSSTLQSVQYLGGGAVAVLELCPVLMYKQDHFGQAEDSLLTREQLHSLSRLLYGSSEAMPVQTLLLLSPIPFVLNDESLVDHSTASTEHLGIHYTTREVAEVLDLVTAWVEAEPSSREVIFICGGALTNFTTSIKVESKGRGIAAPSNNPSSPNVMLGSMLHDQSFVTENTADSFLRRPKSRGSMADDGHLSFEIQQICCGPLCGVLDEPATIRRDGSIFSAASARRYRFHHHLPATSEARCGIVEIHHHATPHADRSTLRPSEMLKKALKSNVKLVDANEFFLHMSSVLAPSSTAVRIYSQCLLRTRLLEADIHNLLQELPALIKHLFMSYLIQDFQGEGQQQRRAEASPLLQRPLVQDIVKVLNELFEHDIVALKNCHAVYRTHAAFPLISVNCHIEKIALQLYRYVWDRLDAQTRQICKLPSRLTIRLCWEVFVSFMHEQSLNLQSANKGTGLQSAKDITLDLISLLETSEDHFTCFLRVPICVQIVMECLSLQEGLLD